MMKKRFIWPALLLLLCCCTEKEGLPSADRLTVETVSTRVQLDGSGRTVWTEGDKFSVFYNSDSNERWKYTGKTGAASGQIEYLLEWGKDDELREEWITAERLECLSKIFSPETQQGFQQGLNL